MLISFEVFRKNRVLLKYTQSADRVFKIFQRLFRRLYRMLSFLKKLFKIGEAEAQNYLDKKEDPMKMSEQAVRDLKRELAESLRALAEIKTITINAKREADMNRRGAAEYEQKAILLLQKASVGEITEAEADRLAEQALAQKSRLDAQAQQSETNLQNYEGLVNKLDDNVQMLKSQITSIEQEVRSLRARSKVSEATKRLHEQMSHLNEGGALQHIEKMRQRVENLEIQNETNQMHLHTSTDASSSSLDAEINALLGISGSEKPAGLPPSSALQQLKREIKSRESHLPPNESDGFNPILP